MFHINTGYKTWIAEQQRTRSPELDFGVWWRLINEWPHWRVSWIEDTGELYAVELIHQPDRYIVIAHFKTEEEVEAAMRGWAKGDHDLQTLIQRLQA